MDITKLFLTILSVFLPQFVAVFGGGGGGGGGGTSSLREDIQTLVKNLTDQLDPRIRATRDLAVPTSVRLRLILLSISGFDDLTDTLSTNVIITRSWIDPAIQWNAAQYGGTSRIKVLTSDIWTPGLLLLNGMGNVKMIGELVRRVSVNYAGQVEYKSMEALSSSCILNVRFYPFDEQKCSLEFVTDTDNNKDIEFTDTMMVTDRFQPNSKWELTGVTNETDIGGPGSWVTVTFTLSLKRRPTVHFGTEILPPFLLMILASVSFIIPVSSGEKVSFCVSNFLATVVYVTYTASNCPRTANTVSIFVLYLGYITLSSIVNVILTAIVSYIYSKQGDVPAWIHRFYTKQNNVTPMKKNEDDHSVIDTYVTVTWERVAASINKIFLWIFLVITVIPTGVVTGILLLLQG